MNMSMFKKLLSLFVAIGIFVVSSHCIHSVGGLSLVPTTHAAQDMSFSNDDADCAGKSSGMNCCLGARSGNLEVLNSSQSQKLIMHLVPALHFTFCEFQSDSQDAKKNFQIVPVIYQPPPSLTGVIVKKE